MATYIQLDGSGGEIKRVTIAETHEWQAVATGDEDFETIKIEVPQGHAPVQAVISPDAVVAYSDDEMPVVIGRTGTPPGPANGARLMPGHTYAFASPGAADFVWAKLDTRPVISTRRAPPYTSIHDTEGEI